MIVLIDICENRFHSKEFVRPIENILENKNINFSTIFYKELTEKILLDSDKIIISGTSLKDNIFIKNISKFDWIKNYNKPILGICGGMHILGLLFKGKLIPKQEIGLTKIYFKKSLFDNNKELEVYELHNYYVKSSEFEIIAESKTCPQVIKHINKPFFGFLFHPEVRNKKLILHFNKINKN